MRQHINYFSCLLLKLTLNVEDVRDINIFTFYEQNLNKSCAIVFSIGSDNHSISENKINNLKCDQVQYHKCMTLQDKRGKRRKNEHTEIFEMVIMCGSAHSPCPPFWAILGNAFMGVFK